MSQNNTEHIGSMKPQFDLYYSIAPKDVKINSGPTEDNLQSRIKSFKVYSDLKDSKPENEIGRLLMREIVHLDEDNKVSDYSTILELVIHRNSANVEKGFGVKFHAHGGTEMKLAASGTGVTNSSEVGQKIIKKRVGTVTSTPETSRRPKLGEKAFVSITTFPNTSYKQITVTLEH